MMLRLCSLLILHFTIIEVHAQVTLDAIKNFTYCYESTLEYTNSVLNYKGYYKRSVPYMRPIYDKKTGARISEEPTILYSNMMFFKDGVVVSGFQFLIENREDNYDYFVRLRSKKQLLDDLFYNSCDWGVYRIEGDIIKVQFFSPPFKFSRKYLVEEWFKINEDNSLVVIYKKSLTRNEVMDLNESDKIPFYFLFTNFELPSDTWLKKQEWFWCDVK